MVNKGYKQTIEHKRKIGLANSISNKGKHCSPNTEFKKGHERVWTDEEKKKVSKEKSYLWNGGISRLTAKKICIGYGLNIKTCQICQENGRMIIHHIDGNRKNNNIRNLGIVCYFCHNAMHDTPNRKATRFKVNHPLNKHDPMEILN
jgi:5-methylcytosine-specific restriction endonuclease McrA